MLKIVRSATSDAVTFFLSGRVDMEHTAQLQAAFDTETVAIVVDMCEVRRVDREVVAILASWCAQGIRLENCPAYLCEWIAKAGVKN
jgi:ABC-type transporter Mla MlaB component